MNILISVPHFMDPGGVANYYKIILPYLTRDPSLHISLVHVGSSGASAIHFLNDPIKMLRTLSSREFNLLHINPSFKWKSYLRDGFFMLFAKRMNIPVVVFFHGWDAAFEVTRERWLGPFFKRTYLDADAFIVLATDFEKRLRNRKVTAPVYVESTAVDDELIKGFELERKHALEDPAQTLKILFLARLEKEKGIFETIDACTILSSKGYRLHLTVAGDGSEHDAAGAYAAKRLGERVTFVGYVKGEEKRRVFETSDLYLFPSRHGEGMPISVVEAMSFGLPIVTRPVGGIKDFFENGKMGFATPSNDPETFVSLVERLLLDRKLRKAISAYNHAYAREHFLASKVAARLKEIYRLTLGERPPQSSVLQRVSLNETRQSKANSLKNRRLSSTSSVGD